MEASGNVKGGKMKRKHNSLTCQRLDPQPLDYEASATTTIRAQHFKHFPGKPELNNVSGQT